jgi:hypothetical protein
MLTGMTNWISGIIWDNIFGIFITGVKTFFCILDGPSCLFDIMGGELISGLINGIGTKIAETISPGGDTYVAFTDLIGDIRGLLFGNSDLTNPFVAIGNTIVSSMAAGVTGSSTLAQKIYQLVLEAVQWVISHISGSPEYPIFVDIGENMMVSMAMGIANGRGLLRNTLKNTILGAGRGMGFGSTMGSSMAMAPVYGGSSNTMNFGDVNLNSSMDFAMFRSMVQKVITE